MEPITDVDETNESVEYWNDVLKSHNLSMQRGARPNSVGYIGDLNNLQRSEEKQFRKDSGKVDPKGRGPEA